MTQSVSRPLSTSTAKSAAMIIEAVCVPITSLRLSIRSATTPATRPKTVNGRKRQKARRPTASGECVSSTTSHASATFCIHVPLTEMTCPVKKSR